MIDLINNDPESKDCLLAASQRRIEDVQQANSTVGEVLSGRKNKYGPEEKKNFVKLIDKYQEANQCSRQAAQNAIRASIIAQNLKPPTISTLQDWEKKANKGLLDIDDRSVSPEFEAAIRETLFIRELENVSSKGEQVRHTNS